MTSVHRYGIMCARRFHDGNWRRHLLQWFRDFMQGRYGSDKLNTTLLILYWLFSLLFGLSFFWLFRILSTTCIALWAYRFFSRDIVRRQAENRKYIGIAHPMSGHVSSFSKAMRQWYYHSKSLKKKQKDTASHRYYRCPHCGQNLRVPAGMGMISIRCPKCTAVFAKKT